MNKISSFPLFNSSSSETAKSDLASDSHDIFEDVNRRIESLVHMRLDSRPKKVFSSCFPIRIIRYSKVCDRFHLEEEISAIIKKHFDKVEFGLSIYSAQGEYVVGNSTYEENFEISSRMPIYTLRNLDCSAHSFVSISNAHSVDVRLKDGSIAKTQISRSNIFSREGTLICVVDLTEIPKIPKRVSDLAQVAEVSLSASASIESNSSLTETNVLADPLVEEAKNYLERKNILIVDDTPLMLKMTQRTLNIATHKTIKSTLASDGSEAVRLFQEGRRFDCVLMDLNMPMPGVVATEEIRKVPGCLTVPIIAWSTEDKDACREMIAEAGMSGYCFKDAKSTNELLILMARLIRDYKTQNDEWVVLET